MQAQVSDALSSKRNTQLSSNTSHSYKHLPLQTNHNLSTVLPDKTNGGSTAAAAAEYKTYIDKILKRAGINDKLTPITLGKWHTPSHPLDPSIYYYLELFHPTAAAAAAATCGVLSSRCNRKLIFQLVDEILVEILQPHLDLKPWASPITGTNDQFGLIDGICKRIESYPAANCQVLEDIDSLIENDLREWKLNGFFEEQGEGLVCEIEGEILGMLVRETVALVGVRTEEGRRQGPIMSRGGLLIT